MANVYKENVWILDTTGTIVSGDLQAGGMRHLRIRKLRWSAPSGGTVGDNCQIREDTGGQVIWEDIVTAVGANNEYVQETNWDGEGFTLRALDDTGLHLTIDSGTLYVYLA